MINNDENSTIMMAVVSVISPNKTASAKFKPEYLGEIMLKA